MKKAEKKATEEISADIKVKGFRPGKVPRHILEQYVDAKYIKAVTQEFAIKKSYADIVVKEKIQAVTAPKVTVDEQDPFSYTAIIPVIPEVTLKDHKSIKVKKEEVKVEDKEIEEVLNDLKKHQTTYNEADRAAKKGNKVEIDFEGFDKEGKSVPNTKSQNHPVVIGEGSLIPGFEEELIGLKPGEEKEFNIKFPKDYGQEDFQGKKMKFKVKLHKVFEPLEPELTPELIKKVTGRDLTLEELKKDIKENITARKEQEVKQKLENDYVEALLKKAKMELSPILIEKEVELMLQELQDNISQKGADFETFLKQAKTDLDSIKKKYEPEAEKRLKTRLALQELIKAEDIKVDDEEIKKELEKVKSYYPETEHAKIDNDFQKGDLKMQITSRITIRKLFDQVLG